MKTFKHVFIHRFSCDDQCRFGVLPHRHNQKTYDDDIWWGCQIQGLVGLRRADHEERGIHVHDEGSWLVWWVVHTVRQRQYFKLNASNTLSLTYYANELCYVTIYVTYFSILELPEQIWTIVILICCDRWNWILRH